MLEINNLKKTFEGGAEALRGVNLNVKKGEFLTILGPSGSGKTTLIKNICVKIGSKDNISSPTFPILNMYESNNEKIYHADLYRIDNILDLNEIGFFDIINEKRWIFIEWPKKIIEC